MRGHTANDGPYAQLMVSACRAIGPRLSKGGLCRRHLGGANSGTLPLTNDVTNGERQLLLGAYNSGVKPPPHSNKPKEPITGRSYKCPFGGHPVNQFSTLDTRSLLWRPRAPQQHLLGGSTFFIVRCSCGTGMRHGCCLFNKSGCAPTQRALPPPPRC